MKVYKKETRTYPNGAILNFMQYKLCDTHSEDGYWAFHWKRGDILWHTHDYKEGVVVLYYFKKDEDLRSDDEINEILKKNVRLFRAFYKASKDIVLKEKGELNDRVLALVERAKKEEIDDKFKKELNWLITFHHVYWLEYDNQKALNQMNHLFTLKNRLNL